MFLPAGLRLVAGSCVGLGIANSVFLLIYLLTLPPDSAVGAYLAVAMLVTQGAFVAVGLGLFQMSSAAWIGFWGSTLLALALAGTHALWLKETSGVMLAVPVYIAVVLLLWFVPSAICLLLPSSRKFYFHEPDSVWMHKRMLRAQARAAKSISGSPHAPVGVSLLAFFVFAFAAGLFILALYSLARPTEGPAPQDDKPLLAVVLLLILLAIGLAVASIGLFRTRRWGWYTTLAYAGVAAVVTTVLLAQEAYTKPGWVFPVGHASLLVCLLWSAVAIVYLLLPQVRYPFFRRRGSRRYR